MKPTVFIHTNAPQLIGAKVTEHAIKKASSHADQFDVKILQLEDYPHLTTREGQTYRRKGQKVTWHNRDLQSFTPLRFLPPQYMGFEGRSVVIDPDVFPRGDMWELLDRDMQGKAILCRLIEPTDGRPPFYASSVLVMDNAKLTHWRWEETVDELLDHKWDYGDWVSLRREDPETIGPLEEEWNQFDKLTDETKALHTTERRTQPWKTGLPIDFNLNYAPPGGLRGALRRLTGRGAAPAGTAPASGHYEPHPDPDVEQFFFGLVHDALEDGAIDEDFLRSEMEQNHLRHDAFEVLDRVVSKQR